MIALLLSSSDDDEVMKTSQTISLGSLFEELQNTQVNIRDTRTNNCGTHKKLTNLTKKLSNRQLVISLLLVKNLY